MTNVFIGRAELLPAGETTEQHAKWLKEEADAVQQDKDNPDPRTGGLFKGCFRPAPTSHSRGHSLQVIRDQEDGVERCPVCSWELEDGECIQCGLFFDENGELTWTDSFTGFSDMDEMSEHDLSGEDLDAEMGMDDGDYDGYGGPGWPEFYADDGNYVMQRFLERRIPPPHAPFGRRRHMSHSEAGSRRSYSQSIASDLLTEEMDTVEEEDEEGIDEDSSMNDFIDDEMEGSSTSASASSTPGQTPQPSNARSRMQGRARRVVESETSSTISSNLSSTIEEEEEDDDEEDQGPIRRGQRNERNRAQNRILNRANGSREPSGPPSSTSTDASTDDLDEDTQALLRSEGWMLQHHGPDEMDEDDDSDGGRTTVGSTVGWDATAISNDRVRMGGSLTPTADRPRPNATIRPPSRVGNPLRRLSAANVHYEDGEADDDDSDLEQGVDVAMAMNSLRTRRSRTQLPNSVAFNPHFSTRSPSQGNIDVADNADPSQERYNHTFHRMFADHQRALQATQGGPLVDIEPRSITPIARPRTANRNRPSPAQVFPPFMPPAPSRLRTPLMNNSANTALNPRSPASPPRRVASNSLSEIMEANPDVNTGRAASVSSVSSSSVILTPGTSTPTSQASSTVATPQVGASIDPERPPSRVSRPPSAAGRRNSAGFSPVYPAFPHPSVGLNVQGRFPYQAGNPWASFVQPQRIRSRNSRQVLREQSSTATLRPASSRANIQSAVYSPQVVRSQGQPIELRPQPSRRRLNSQASNRTLRASDHARPPPSPITNAPSGAPSPFRPMRHTPEERNALARELINTRMQALNQPGAAPGRNNPFVQGFRRPSNSSDTPPTNGTMAIPHHSRNNSSESVNSGNSSHTTTGPPSSPALTRRRSNRHIAASPPGALPPSHVSQHQTPSYTNNYYRTRQNSVGNGSSTFDVPLDANARGMAPMMAASLI